jgi:peptide/nickel transport system substrate-binding protein
MRDVVLGSGPFVFEEYDPTAGGRLTRNERYWERGKPYLDSLRLDILPDKRTALAALATRRLDLYLEEASAQDVALVDRSVPGVVAWRWRDPVAGPEVLVNASKSPFHDVRVRKALRLAVDNDAMHRADSNKGSLAWNSPLGLTAWGLSQEELSRRDEHAASLSARQRAARELLQQAGVRSGLQVTVMVADPAQESASGGQPAGLFGSAPSTITSPKAVAKAEVLAESFRALGLDVPPVQKRSPSQFQTDLLLLRYDVAVVDIEFEGYPDPDGLKSFWADRGPRNYTGFRDPELDALLRQQSVVLATGERMEMVQQIQRQILDSYAAFYLPLALPNEESPAVALSQPWVRGFRYDWLGARLGNLRFDEVWLDSPPAR